MKRSWMLAAAAAALLGCSAGTQAKDAAATATPPPAVTKPAAGPADKPTEARPPAADKAPAVPPKPDFDAAMMDQLLVIAVAQPWAAKDAEAQVLVEKLLGARKNMLQAEMDRIAVFQKVAQAARTGDAATLKTVTEELRAASGKVRQEGAAIGQDVNALLARLQQIKPSAQAPAKEPAEQPKTK